MSNHILKEELKRNNSITQEKIFVRVAEASKLFGISQSQLWSLISKAELNAFRPSPKITLLKITDLISYIEKMEIK